MIGLSEAKYLWGKKQETLLLESDNLFGGPVSDTVQM